MACLAWHAGPRRAAGRAPLHRATAEQSTCAPSRHAFRRGRTTLQATQAWPGTAPGGAGAGAAPRPRHAVTGLPSVQQNMRRKGTSPSKSYLAVSPIFCSGCPPRALCHLAMPRGLRTGRAGRAAPESISTASPLALQPRASSRCMQGTRRRCAERWRGASARAWCGGAAAPRRAATDCPEADHRWVLKGNCFFSTLINYFVIFPSDVTFTNW